MKHYVDQSLEAYPKIKILVLTGGECFTLKEDLNAIIRYAKRKKLSVRCVTKGTEKDTYFAVNKFLENQIDDFINILKETNSTFFENNKEEDIRNFLTINMYK